MAEITEIYICQEGQQLKEGRLEVSRDVADKPSAEVDARERCREDSSIFKLAYYRTSDSGDFRIFYTYTNPRHRSKLYTKDTRKPSTGNPIRQKKKKKPATMMGKFKKLFK